MDRHRIFIIAFAILLLLIVIIGGGWWWTHRSTTTPVPTANTPGATLPSSPSTTPAAGSEAGGVVTESAEVAVIRLSRLFSQQFATYSSQGKFEGIADMTPYTTASFRAWFTGPYLDSLRAAGSVGTYSGQTIQVMSVEISDINGTSATVAVKAQRVISQGTPPIDTITYPTLALGLKNENGQWLIDSARWQ